MEPIKNCISSSLKGETVTVIVGTGPETEHFTLHLNLLISSSPVFEAMMTKDNFRECKEKVIRLPEDPPDAFALFAHWLYTRRLPDYSMEEYDKTRQEIDLRAFVFGDKYRVPEFKQDNYKRVLFRFEEDTSWPSAEFIELLYSYGPVTAKIQSYFVDYVAHILLIRGVDPDELQWLEKASRSVPKFAAATISAMTKKCECGNDGDTPANDPEYQSCEGPQAEA